jgi:hypothetical protein
MRILVGLVVAASLAACAGSRSAAFTSRLERLRFAASTTEVAGDTIAAIRAWDALLVEAARAPPRLRPQHRAAACGHAAHADSQLRALLHDGSAGLFVRGHDVVYYVDGVLVAQPDPARRSASRSLDCP